MIPGYKSIKEVSEEWGITPRRVQGMCAEGLIPGATKINNRWVVPNDCDRPADGRETTGEFKNWRKSTQQKRFTTEASGVLDILSNMPGGYFMYRADKTEEIIAVNQALIMIYGCKTEEEFREYVGNSFKGMVHPQDYLRVSKNIQRQMEHLKEKTNPVEYRIICKDDTIRTVSESVKLINTKEYGNVYAVFVDEPVDRVTRSLSSLEQIFYRILKVNLTNDSFVVIKSFKNELSKAKGYDNSFTQWMKNYADLGLIHKDDLSKYYTFTNKTFLSDYFKRTSKPWRLRYRRIVNDQFHWVMCVMFRAEDYTNDNQVIQLYVQNTDDNFPDMRMSSSEVDGDLQIFQAAAQVIYPTCYTVNLSQNSYHTVSYDGNAKRVSAVDGVYDELTASEAISIPDGDMRDDFLSIFQKEKMLEAFISGKRECMMRYRKYGVDGMLHWMDAKGVFVTQANGEMCAVLFLRCCDDEMENEESMLSLLKSKDEDMKKAEDSFEVMNTLARDYSDIFIVDEKNDTFEIYRGDDSLDKGDSYLIAGTSKTMSEYLEQFIKELVMKEDRDDFRIWLYALKQEMSINPSVNLHTYNFRRLYQDSYLYYQLTVARLTTKNDKAYIVFGFRNIDSSSRKDIQIIEGLKKERDEALAREREKTEFIFDVSHDIRTPMNTILGFSDMLVKHRYEDDFMNYVENIQISGRRLMSAFEEVYEMARIEGGMVIPHETVLPEIHDYIDTILVKIMDVANQKNVSITPIIHVSNAIIESDQYLLTEIYHNVLSTLLKFSGGGNILLSIRELEDNNGIVTYQSVIEDSSSLMSADTFHHLFDGFKGAGMQHSPELSMGITKKAVGLLGGEIEAQQNMGVRFIITIPHKIAKKGLEDMSSMDTTIFLGKRVLLAEDNELNRELAKEILEDLGFVVDTATDGIDCVSRMTMNPSGFYNLILMDIQMPNMDGYTASMIIRHLEDKKKANTPIIALSASVFDEDKKKAFDSGMNDFAEKPIDMRRLYQSLIKYMA